MMLKDNYFTLKDLLVYTGTQLSKDYNAVTLSQFYNQFKDVSNTLTNSSVLATCFSSYVIPTYLNNSCLKVTTTAYSAELEVADILQYDEMQAFTNRIASWAAWCQPYLDKLEIYSDIYENIANGKVKATTAVLKNNDTPQISGSGATQNDGFTNNVQINTGTETETLGVKEQLEAIKLFEDYNAIMAKEFRNRVMID